MTQSTTSPNRCAWAQKEILHRYHDTEWGVPLYNDQLHFEYLILDCSQAGLSWELMLKKREGYRRAFAGFDPHSVARFTERDVEKLMLDSGIVRNRNKIMAAITNAQVFEDIQQQFGSYTDYFWSFSDGSVINNQWKDIADIPTTSKLSDQFATDLKQRGAKFIGSTTIYAYLQGAGMINDHTVDCFRHQQVIGLKRTTPFAS